MNPSSNTVEESSNTAEESFGSTVSLFQGFLLHAKSTAETASQEEGGAGPTSGEDDGDLSSVIASMEYERAKLEARPEADVHGLWVKAQRSRYAAHQKYIGEVKKYHEGIPTYERTQRMQLDLKEADDALAEFGRAVDVAISQPTEKNKEEADDAEDALLRRYGDV